MKRLICDWKASIQLIETGGSARVIISSRTLGQCHNIKNVNKAIATRAQISHINISIVNILYNNIHINTISKPPGPIVSRIYKACFNFQKAMYYIYYTHQCDSA